MKPYVCSVISLKGGVGKTSLTIGIAGAISQVFHKKVLVLDLDPSANATNYFRQMTGTFETLDGTILSCMEGKSDPAACVREYDCYRTKGLEADEKSHYFTETKDHKEDNNFPRTRESVLSMIPGDKDIIGLEINDPNVLSNILKQDAFKDYDYVFIDCPPEVMNTTVAALFASEGIIAVIEPGSDSIEGLDDIVGNLMEVKQMGHDIKVMGIVMNKFAGNEWASQFYYDTLKKKAGTLLFDHLVPRSSSAEKARSIGLIPTVFEGFSPYSKALTGIALEIEERTKA